MSIHITSLPTLALGILLCGGFAPVSAQRTLTLEECRNLALQNNKELKARKLGQQDAAYAKKAARTNYLPKVDVVANYTWTSKEISLLDKDQKATFANLGTNTVSGLTNTVTSMVQNGLLTQEQAASISQQLGQLSGPITQIGNQLGQQINDAFRTDTRNIFFGAAEIRQPIYMGGAIIAENKIADIRQTMADNTVDLQHQTTLYAIDNAYWTTVSLRQKQRLAESYRDLVKKLDTDVKKMIRQGIATRADGLKVAVKVNQADMQIVQVENGLSLSKMLLCQLCGLPLEEDIALADEDENALAPTHIPEEDLTDNDTIAAGRPEIRLLENTAALLDQKVNLTRAAFLPKVFAVGGYAISNPNLFNGFERKFSGVWNIGLTVAVPVWNWFEGANRVKSAKTQAAIARLTIADTEEKIRLQISQARFKCREAEKRMQMADSNLTSANENLRSANIGFREGVMQVTDVMAAQTAWQQARADVIDAQVDLRIAQVALQKALGTLR